MDQSTQDLANWYNAAPSDRNTDGTVSRPSSGGSLSGFITPPKAGGTKTTNDSTVYPVAAPETPAGALLGQVGIKNTGDMMTIALFGGLVILVMSLFKG